MTKKSLFNLLKAWNQPLVLVEASDGPLAFGARQGTKASGGQHRRTDEGDRLALAAQTGAVSILAPILPEGALSRRFSITEARKFADEIGTTIFHLLAEGAQIEDLLSSELDLYVNDRISAFLKSHKGLAPVLTRPGPNDGAAARAPPKSLESNTAIFDRLDALEKTGGGEESPFFPI